MVDWLPQETADDSRVQSPAIALIVVAVLGILGDLAILAMSVLMLLASSGRVQLPPELEQALAAQQQGDFQLLVNLVMYSLALIVQVVIAFAAVRMMNVRSYGLALTGAILAVIPLISPCCVLGIPFGIWALVVLSRPDVRAAFANRSPSYP